MARKRLNTPLPKVTGRKVQEKLEPTFVDRLMGRDPNVEQTRAERDASIQRIIILTVMAAVALIAVALIIAFIADGVIRPRQAVATVNGEDISVSDFQKRVRIERGIRILLINDILNDIVEQQDVTVEDAGNFVLQQEPYATWWNELGAPDVMGLTVLDDMVDDKLIAKAAADLGVSVSDADIDTYINKQIGYDPEAVALIGAEPTATVEPTSTPTPFVSPTPTTAPTSTPEPTATPEATAAETTPEAAEGTPAAVEATTVAETVVPELTATATSTAAPTEAVPTLSVTEVVGNFETQKRNFVSEIASMAGVSENDVREVLRTKALRSAIGEKLAADSDTSESTGDEKDVTLYADARHILVETEAEAQDIIAALNAGDSFAELAKAVSTDTGSGANGGELGWAPIANYVEPFANAIRDAEVGTFVGPVESEFGFHIIQVRAKENREAEAAQVERANSLALTAWLSQLRTDSEGQFTTNNTWASNIPTSPLWRYIER